MIDKEYFFNEEDIKDLVFDMGYSICSNKIYKEGHKVGFMYREEPLDDEDSGWRFMAGTEEQEYADDPDNSKIIGVNTIANHDPAIIPYLKSPVETELARIEGGDEFEKIEI
jgi:hypothetical protein